jgi:DNA polymerase-1
MILIVDGHSLAYRSYFAFPATLRLTPQSFQNVLDFEYENHLISERCQASEGLIVNTIYGFTALLLKAIETLNPTHVCVCFDCKAPTFRHIQYEAYKANRPSPPDDFVEQTPHLKRLLSVMGIPTIEKSGYEADDLIGTLAKHAAQNGVDVRIMTGDHDALQLVNDQIFVVMGKQSELIIYDTQKVVDQYGLTPSQIVDYKALRGDTSDNIPGVRGIGEKTATQLLQTYQTLEKIYAHLDEIKPPGVQEKLRLGWAMAELSKELATINCQAPLEVSLEACRFAPNGRLIAEAFKRYEFRSLVPKAEKWSAPHPKNEPIVRVNSRVFPPTHLWPSPNWDPSSFKQGMSVAMDLDHPDQSNGLLPTLVAVCAGDVLWELPDTPEAWACLSPLLEDPQVPLYTQDGKALIKAALLRGIQIQNLQWDCGLMTHLIDPITPANLDHAASLAGIQWPETEDRISTVAWKIDQLVPPLTQMLKDHNKEAVYTQIERPLLPVLAKMEWAGIRLDSAYLQQLQYKLETQLHELKAQCYAHVGFEFNLSSPKQLAEVLFDHLNLPVIKKTKTGRSTDASVLEKLTGKDPMIEWVLSVRQLEKLLSTYVIPLPGLVNPMTGRIHTSFNQSVTTTGRLSSVHPNLQNIPIRTEEGLDIRQAFIPSSAHHHLLSADYSQIELRILAHLSQDQHMIEAFSNNEDIHTSTASRVFQIPLEAVTKEQRYKAKAINFGIIYGISAFGLSQQLNIPASEAQEIITHYFQMFPAIRSFIESTLESARAHQEVWTEFGRSRPLPDILAKNMQLRQFAERTAVNTRIQGTAAELIKLAMIRLDHRLIAENAHSQLVLQVHDELVLDVPEFEVENAKIWVRDAMSGVVSWSVPLHIDIAVGPDWKVISI